MSTVLPDIPRIYTALAEWLACIVYIAQLKKHIKGWGLIAFSGGFLIVQSLFLILTKDLPIFFVPEKLCACINQGLVYQT